jgi:hypothetical protein
MLTAYCLGPMPKKYLGIPFIPFTFPIAFGLYRIQLHMLPVPCCLPLVGTYTLHPYKFMHICNYPVTF